MPFVNRHKDVFELLKANVDCLGRQLSTVDMPFAAQLFDYVKTALGQHFIPQLSDSDADSYIRKRLKENVTGSAKAKKEFLKTSKLAKGARQLRIDLRGAS